MVVGELLLDTLGNPVDKIEKAAGPPPVFLVQFRAVGAIAEAPAVIWSDGSYGDIRIIPEYFDGLFNT